MTTINPMHQDPLPTPADARARMQFSGAPPRIGVEIEYHIQDNIDGGPAHDGRVRLLKDAMRQRGFSVDDEIGAHMIEVKTQAYELADARQLMNDIDAIQAAITEEAAALGLSPLATANMPGLTVERAMENLIQPTNAEPERGLRARMMMAAIREQGMGELIPFPLLSTSAQASVTARNPEHLYDMAQRHYKLLPFLMAALHNRAPEGDDDTRHGGIAVRRMMGRRGLMPMAFTRSLSAEDYVAKTLETAYERPMMCYIDAQGQFNAAAADEKTTMQTLQAKGLATAANAALSQSMDWHAVKIKTVPGTPVIRAEMRDIDTGADNAKVLAAINALMNMDPECGRDIDSTLAGYGYAGAPVCYADMLARDMKRVEENGDAGINIRYGHGFMNYFAREFVGILMRYAPRYGLEEALAPLAAIAETGVTAAQKLRARSPQP